MSEEEKSELSTFCRQLKLEANDGKKYKTDVAVKGGNIAKNAKLELEKTINKSIVTPKNAKDFIKEEKEKLESKDKNYIE